MINISDQRPIRRIAGPPTTWRSLLFLPSRLFAVQDLHSEGNNTSRLSRSKQ